MPKKTFAVTVTYDDRFHLLKQVIEAALREGVDKVIVVDNNSEPNSREKLKKYHRKNPEKIDVLYLSENFGSAGGFKRGLKKAYNDPECEFIWLLDDDNKPQPGALQLLKEYWKKYETREKDIRLALASYRECRGNYAEIEALMSKDPEIVLGKKNNFYHFHIAEIPKYMKRIIRRKIVGESRLAPPGPGQIAATLYGGLFFHKKLLEVIGYPLEDFYIYEDDIEWTYRITKNRGKIILIPDSIITDIDRSWYITDEKETALTTFSPSNTFRIYYTIRNGFYFRMRHRVDNKFIYYFNCLTLLFLILLYTIIFFRDLSPFKTVITAIRDARGNKLGKIERL